MTEKTIGYARSAVGVDDMETQIKYLQIMGCSEIHTDHADSTDGLNRPGLKRARAALRPGDTLLVNTLDRISTFPADLETFLTGLLRDGISFDAIEHQDIVFAQVLKLNHGPVIGPDTPFLRKIAYRLGAWFIRVSGRGPLPAH